MTGDVKLLMVDDDMEFTSLVEEYFSNEGGYVIAVSHNGAEGIEAIQELEVDIVILDITMPAMNGLETLKVIRKTSNVPVVMLTARGDEIDRIIGLEFGADDYIAKPCNLRELAARIRAVLRRTHASSEVNPSKKIVLGDVSIDLGSQAVIRKGETVFLTGAEYLMLETLACSAGTVVSKHELAKQALGRRLFPHDRSVDIHIGHLRKKLGLLPDGSQRIKTLRGQGYLYITPS